MIKKLFHTLQIEMVFRSPYPEVTSFPSCSLPELVFSNVKEHGENVAFVHAEEGRSVTYGQLWNDVQCFASAMAQKGFKQKEILAIYLPNCIEYPILFHGTLLLGGIVTTVNSNYTEAEIAHQLHDSGAQYFVCLPSQFDLALRLKRTCKLKKVVLMGELPKDAREMAFAFLEYKSLISKADPTKVPKVKILPKNDIAVLPYSSGTTGLSKGVMLSHFNIIANLHQLQTVEKLTPKDVLLGLLPFYHIYGMVVIMNAALWVKAKSVVISKFDFTTLLNVLEQEGVTIAHLVPPTVIRLSIDPMTEKISLPKLRCIFSGAAPLGEGVATAVEKRLNVAVRQGYGMTELSPISHLSPLQNTRPGSVGFLVSNTEGKVVDDKGAEVALGHEGELLVRGPQVMMGYYKNEKATNETIDAEGWLHTGDIVVVDGEGFTYVVDRKKELIKTKGFQVPPAELEAVLLTHNSVADCAVIGVEDAKHGEVPKAFVVVKKNQTVAEEDLQDHVARKVAHYKRIKYIEFVDSIPKTASGKILRRDLREKEKAKAKIPAKL